MDTRRALVLALLVVLAGCSAGAGGPAATPSPTETATPSPTASPTPTATPSPTPTATATPKPRYENPWGKERVVVGIDGLDDERDYEALVREGLAYWTADRIERHGSYPVEFVVQPGADEPDIEVEVVSSLEDCGYTVKLGGWLGCAPILDADSDPAEPTVVEISADQTNTEFENTVAHEFGHVLGLDHGEAPVWLMTHGNTSTVATDAADRPNPWNDTDDIEVYVREGFENQATVERDVRAAVDYYDRNPEYLPPGVGIRMVDHWYEADIIFQNRSPPGVYEVRLDPGSQPYIVGLDWDRDYAWEWYIVAWVYIEGAEELDTERHAGYWLGRFMNVPVEDLPEQYK